MTCYSYFDSPLGRMLLKADGAELTGLDFVDGRYAPTPGADWRLMDNAMPFDEVRRQLDQYWAGERTIFDLPIRPVGTPFQRRVWDRISGIAFGMNCIVTQGEGEVLRIGQEVALELAF